MKKGGYGGSKTAKNGLNFEKKVDYLSLLSRIDGYRIINTKNDLHFCKFFMACEEGKLHTIYK